MVKNLYKQSIEELENLIKTNSKDAHYAKKLIVEYKQKIKESLHEPTLIHVPLNDIEKEKKGKTFSISKCSNGSIVYHVYGGYSLVIEPRMQSVYSYLSWYLNIDENSLGKEEKELLDCEMSAFAYIVASPIFACTDPKFRFEVATKIVNELQNITDKYMNDDVVLQEEDHDANNDFERSMSSAESIINILNEASEQLKNEEV